MAVIRPIISNLSRGELGKLLHRRGDITHYYNGAESLLNMIGLVEGGQTRREGLRFIAETKDSTKKSRLIPFEFSTTQAYMLEFGDEYIRFYRNQGQILSGETPYEISTPYSHEELADLDYAQDSDLMYIVHPNHEPMVLSRSGHTDWSLDPIDWKWPPMRKDNTKVDPDGHTMTPSAATGSITITSSEAFFTADMVDGYIRIKDGYAEITGFTSATVVSATVIEDLGTGSATDLWAIGAFSEENGFPSSVVIFEQRLVFASTRKDPDSVWLSEIEIYESFERGDVDSNSLLYNISQEKQNKIEFVSAAGHLVLGTSGGPFSLGSGSDDLALTPDNVRVRHQNPEGSKKVKASLIQTGLYYVHRSGRKLLQYTYNIESDKNKSINVSVLSKHLIKKGIKEMFYLQYPYSVLMSITNDGKIACMTRDEDQETLGLTPLETDGNFESGGAIPTSDGSYDEAWFIVERTIGEQSKRYVEMMTKPFDEIEDEDSVLDSFYVDSGLIYSGAPTTTITGLGHLEGKTVQVVTDGAWHPDRTVSSGQITLEREASHVLAGLKYISRIKTLPLETATPFESRQAYPKSIFSATITFYKTMGSKIGKDSQQLDSIPFRKTTDLMNNPVPLFTGNKRVNQSGWQEDGQIIIEQDLPFPMTVTGIVLEAEV